MQRIGVFLFIIVCSVSVHTLPLEHYLQHLSEQDKAKLLEKNELVSYSEGSEGLPDFSYLPDIQIAERIRNEFNGFNPNVSDEALFLLPKADGVSLLDIHNSLQEISTLSGIQYHSNHYRELRTLFENVYRIESMKNREAQPDKTSTRALSEDRFFLHLKDVNFGSSFYEAVYFNSTTETSIGLKNVTSLRYGFVPLITKENVRFHLAVIPTDDGILVYGICAVRAGSFIREMIHLPSSFYTRLKALRDWLKLRIYE